MAIPQFLLLTVTTPLQKLPVNAAPDTTATVTTAAISTPIPATTSRHSGYHHRVSIPELTTQHRKQLGAACEKGRWDGQPQTHGVPAPEVVLALAHWVHTPRLMRELSATEPSEVCTLEASPGVGTSAQGVASSERWRSTVDTRSLVPMPERLRGDAHPQPRGACKAG